MAPRVACRKLQTCNMTTGRLYRKFPYNSSPCWSKGRKPHSSLKAFSRSASREIFSGHMFRNSNKFKNHYIVSSIFGDQLHNAKDLNDLADAFGLLPAHSTPPSARTHFIPLSPQFAHTPKWRMRLKSVAAIRIHLVVSERPLRIENILPFRNIARPTVWDADAGSSISIVVSSTLTFFKLQQLDRKIILRKAMAMCRDVAIDRMRYDVLKFWISAFSIWRTGSISMTSPSNTRTIRVWPGHPWGWLSC